MVVIDNKLLRLRIPLSGYQIPSSLQVLQSCLKTLFSRGMLTHGFASTIFKPIVIKFSIMISDAN